MNNPKTPFERFEQLAKTVVRVPKKEGVKLKQKRKADAMFAIGAMKQ